MKYTGREISSLSELGKGKSRKAKKAVPLVNGFIGFLEFEMPIQLICSTNKREHWGAVAARKKEQRQLSAMYTRACGACINPVFPMTVTLTRLGKRMMDKQDNLPTSCKYCVDGIADALGIDDGDETKVKWLYSQEIGRAYGCRVEIKMS